eukprot:1724687-Amphidinium_carterae.1
MTHIKTSATQTVCNRRNDTHLMSSKRLQHRPSAIEEMTHFTKSATQTVYSRRDDTHQETSATQTVCSRRDDTHQE